jgi:hypothetical protein
MARAGGAPAGSRYVDQRPYVVPASLAGPAHRRRPGGQDVRAVYPRDFLDMDAALASGRYTREQLLEIAEQADAGFDRRVLADLFAMLARYRDRRFAAYGADPAQISAM